MTWPELADLELLVAVDRHGGVGAAARALGVAQPNASRTLARLERTLGLALVHRTPRGSTLTDDGRLVGQWATGLLAEAERWQAAVGALTRPRSTELLVAASQTVAEYLAPAWLAALRAESPEVAARLAVQNSDTTVELVRSGDAEVGFVEGPVELAGLHSIPVARDRLVLVVAADHRWARRRRPVTAAEIAAAPLVVREAGSGTRSTLEAALAAVLPPLRPATPALVLSSNTAVLGAVAAGAGPAVISNLADRGAVASGAIVEVRHELDLARELRALWRPPRRLAGPAGALVRLAMAGPGGGGRMAP